MSGSRPQATNWGSKTRYMASDSVLSACGRLSATSPSPPRRSIRISSPAMRLLDALSRDVAGAAALRRRRIGPDHVGGGERGDQAFQRGAVVIRIGAGLDRQGDGAAGFCDRPGGDEGERLGDDFLVLLRRSGVAAVGGQFGQARGE